MTDKKGLAFWFQVIQQMQETEIKKIEIINPFNTNDVETKDEKIIGRFKLTSNDGTILIMKLEFEELGGK